MHQVAVCRNEERQCNGLQDRCLMHHLQCTVTQVEGPKLMHHACTMGGKWSGELG